MMVATTCTVFTRYIFTPSGPFSDTPPPETIRLSSVKKPAILSLARAIPKSPTSPKDPQTHPKPLASPAFTQRPAPFRRSPRRLPPLCASHPYPQICFRRNPRFLGSSRGFRSFPQQWVEFALLLMHQCRAVNRRDAK